MILRGTLDVNLPKYISWTLNELIASYFYTTLQIMPQLFPTTRPVQIYHSYDSLSMYASIVLLVASALYLIPTVSDSCSISFSFGQKKIARPDRGFLRCPCWHCKGIVRDSSVFYTWYASRMAIYAYDSQDQYKPVHLMLLVNKSGGSYAEFVIFQNGL